MNCAEFEQVIHDLDRPGTPGLALRDTALAHAESCGHCAQLMTEAESLDFSLQILGSRDAVIEAPPRVEAVLLQEFRRHKIESSRKAAPWRIAALGVAAAVLLAVGVLLQHDLTANRAAGTPLQIVSNQTGSPASGASESVLQEEQNQSDDSEYVTSYIPLPGASDPATLEDGSIVRVVLSRSALASLGLPVADTGAADQVSADLVLSEDGAPQAIRLVSRTGDNQ